MKTPKNSFEMTVKHESFNSNKFIEFLFDFKGKLEELERINKMTGLNDINTFVSNVTMKDGSEGDLVMELDGLYFYDKEKKAKARLRTAEEVKAGHLNLFGEDDGT